MTLKGKSQTISIQRFFHQSASSGPIRGTLWPFRIIRIFLQEITLFSRLSNVLKQF